ncbi:uncharacterized protein BX663DRAFT_544712 [Cokeromyces recurvatus]|uniref:uncharacterized protein n=1 Tax=Cokeromyces recurvatus TaxID=90255 RepID=UPI00221EE348|nr:uncharacterized protein BX663DRAFT_544712 [Cokeromyces recurvatus]KAI7900534.1 hypothetical protein BX663DRAFT_544712 [Cokeromyces recurvatus]
MSSNQTYQFVMDKHNALLNSESISCTPMEDVLPFHADNDIQDLQIRVQRPQPDNQLLTSASMEWSKKEQPSLASRLFKTGYRKYTEEQINSLLYRCLVEGEIAAHVARDIGIKERTAQDYVLKDQKACRRRKNCRDYGGK